MFAEDIGLMPLGLFSELLDRCVKGQNTYDILGGLFSQMNSPTQAKAGSYKGVPYFNGGIFRKIQPLELDDYEVGLLYLAALEDWSKVKPAIFGTLFQSSMDKKQRHALGAHFTSEADIQRVILPTISRIWRERIDTAKTMSELKLSMGRVESI